jgi:hypothetical protein
MSFIWPEVAALGFGVAFAAWTASPFSLSRGRP